MPNLLKKCKVIGLIHLNNMMLAYDLDALKQFLASLASG